MSQDHELARQLANLPGFRWAPGMLARDPDHDYRSVRVLGMADPMHTEGVMVPKRQGFAIDYQMRPDGPPPLPSGRVWIACLHDPATGGVLLGWLADMGMQPTADCDAGSWDVGAGKPTEWRWHGPSTTLAIACAKALVQIGRCA